MGRYSVGNHEWTRINRTIGRLCALGCAPPFGEHFEQAARAGSALFSLLFIRG